MQLFLGGGLVSFDALPRCHKHNPSQGLRRGPLAPDVAVHRLHPAAQSRIQSIAKLSNLLLYSLNGNCEPDGCSLPPKHIARGRVQLGACFQRAYKRAWWLQIHEPEHAQFHWVHALRTFWNLGTNCKSVRFFSSSHFIPSLISHSIHSHSGGHCTQSARLRWMSDKDIS